MEKTHKTIILSSISALIVGSLLIVFNSYIQNRDEELSRNRQLAVSNFSATEVDEGKAKISRGTLESLADGATVYCLKTGKMPQSWNDIIEGSPYTLADLRDAWGHQYTFERREDSVLFTCLGRDGQLGGDGPDHDITIELSGSKCGITQSKGIQPSSPAADLRDVKDVLGVE